MRATSSWMVVFILVWVSSGILAADNEAEARKIETLMMAPCCGANTVAMHESGPAQEMRREIRTLLASGMSRQEILDHYVEKYGNTILSMPPTSGFNLTAYALPAIGLILGPLLAWIILRRRAVDLPEDPVTRSPIDPEYRERLEKELRSY